MQATPGDMKSFRSSADKIALMVVEGYEAWVTGLWPIQLEVGGEEEEVRFDLAR